MKHKRFFHLILLVIILTGLVLVGGCGKKGPPLPPLVKGNSVAAPENLAYTLEGSRLSLTWTHAVDAETARIPAEGFEISMATKDEQGCQGCPFIFKSMGIVPMPKMSFTHELEPDLNYYFRVRAMGPDNITSKFSKTLNIDRK